MTLSTRSMDPGPANNGPGVADPLYAYVEDGILYVMCGGHYWQMRQFEAWSEWISAHSSPYPEVQERARQIKAAIDEVYPERLVA